MTEPTPCVHPPQEAPGFDLAKLHHSVWCDECHQRIWYETDTEESDPSLAEPSPKEQA